MTGTRVSNSSTSSVTIHNGLPTAGYLLDLAASTWKTPWAQSLAGA